MPTTLPTRSEVPRAETWDLESLFPDDDAWEAARAALERESLPAVEAFRGRLAEGPAVLASYLAAEESLELAFGRIGLYAIMRANVDSGDESAAALQARAQALSARIRAAVSFAEPELVDIGVDTLRHWIEQESGLGAYGHWLDRFSRRVPHLRSAEVQEVLGLASAPLGAIAGIHGVLANAELGFRPAEDSQGNTHEVAQASFSDLVTSPDRTLRRNAFESYTDAHLGRAKTMAACLSAGVQRDAFLARVQRYDDSLEAATAPGHIPSSVFHNVIDTFRDNVGVWHRYWRVRRAALKLDRLAEYDVKAPLAEPVDVPFDQAVEWIAEGMAPLGDEYVSALRRGVLEERWVDRAPNRGKRLGAFSAGRYDTKPFIFMSYADSLFSMSTLAHELGHSMHKQLTSAAQPAIYSGYGLFLAEIASNFNQALVRAHLLKTHPDPRFQVAVIEEAMSNFHRYFLIMPTLSRFELDIHQRIEAGQALTADGLIERTADLLEEAYGGEVEIDRRRAGSLWAQFPTHLYSNFYPYQYATGIAAAHALADAVLREGEPAAARYLRLLSSGGHGFPIDLLREAGIDMTTREPIERAFGVLDGYVSRLEQLLG
ncbi:MAG TPA: oligoendopeptidase F [Candidatus Dormibacteraeota bacterium]|jgi:oligoendopeptidase F|nr:oligoendopeptidase F [Candidatus Dormibacteraeota bacterium]